MNYTKMSELAKKKCKQFGAMCSVIKITSSYDKTTHSYTETETLYSGYAVVSAYDASLVNGSTIMQGDINVMFTPTDAVSPVSGDKISIGNNTYNIVNVNALSPNGSTVIMYDLQVRA